MQVWMNSNHARSAEGKHTCLQTTELGCFVRNVVQAARSYAICELQME